MYKIAVIGGDGTGPEVVAQAVKVLKATGVPLELTPLDYTAERYLRTGELLSDDELNGLKKFDAILFGAIGDPKIKPGILEKGILLKLRFGLDQYINLRPVKLYENVESPIKNKGPKDINYLVVRENTGGLYSGMGGLSMEGTPHESATQIMHYTRHQVERCVRYAFKQAKRKVTLVGKTNVLTYVFGLWQRTFDEIGKEFPNIETDYIHVDACCIYMIECPERFDVIVTENMFGDIITDLAAVTQGGMGVAPGGNINPEGVSMFEPIGGTAPAFTGLNQINPMASIGSAQLMLRHLGEIDAANRIDAAMQQVFKKMKSMAAGKMGFSTEEIGEMVASLL